MKKFLFTLLVIGLIVVCTEPVLAANIASCENSIRGAIIDEKI